ncbi:MAG: hypothetical protein Q9207_004348 [Kuettlingeria erythrocarpa]
MSIFWNRRLVYASGPEIESWFGVDDGVDPAADNDWSLLPFMALSDGAHAYTLSSRTGENLSDDSQDLPRISLTSRFAGEALRVKMPLLPLGYHVLGKWTPVAFSVAPQMSQEKFQESLSTNLQDTEDERDLYLGLSLRELLHEYKYQTLVLFKCCLLQPKMLFFGSRCERLCMMQFSLISLIPGLLRRLEDCADPEFDSYEKSYTKSSSLKTSDRTSVLSYMGLPIQIFGKGSLFGPYTPLQQLDVLADHGTRSYIIGSTNSLLLQQKDRYSDILINLDESSINITSSSLRTALTLSAADRRWIDFLTQTVTSTWDPLNPSRPNTLAYMGSEEFIRLQFEEYLLALLSSVKYHIHLTSDPSAPSLAQSQHSDPDPILDFNPDWLTSWQTTSSYALFHSFTDPHLFDIVEPRHPTAGNLSIEDIQRRITQQIQTLHLDDRLATTKENLGKHLQTGREKVGTAVGKVWSDIEGFREAQQRRRAEQIALEKDAGGAKAPSRSPSVASLPERAPSTTRFPAARAPDLATAQASVAAAGQRAGAYMSSWGTWAAEKRKGWGVRGPTTGDRGAGVAEKVAEGQRSPRKTKSREERGGDGIGRLDA